MDPAYIRAQLRNMTPANLMETVHSKLASERAQNRCMAQDPTGELNLPDASNSQAPLRVPLNQDSLSATSPTIAERIAMRQAAMREMIHCIRALERAQDRYLAQYNAVELNLFDTSNSQAPPGEPLIQGSRSATAPKSDSERKPRLREAIMRNLALEEAQVRHVAQAPTRELNVRDVPNSQAPPEEPLNQGSRSASALTTAERKAPKRRKTKPKVEHERAQDRHVAQAPTRELNVRGVPNSQAPPGEPLNQGSHSAPTTAEQECTHSENNADQASA